LLIVADLDADRPASAQARLPSHRDFVGLRQRLG
jgi:hypothetical protein